MWISYWTPSVRLREFTSSRRHKELSYFVVGSRRRTLSLAAARHFLIDLTWCLLRTTACFSVMSKEQALLSVAVHLILPFSKCLFLFISSLHELFMHFDSGVKVIFLNVRAVKSDISDMCEQKWMKTSHLIYCLQRWKRDAARWRFKLVRTDSTILLHFFLYLFNQIRWAEERAQTSVLSFLLSPPWFPRLLMCAPQMWYSSAMTPIHCC